MAIPSFYCPELNSALFESDAPLITLSKNESAHAIKSRRLRQGQEVNLLNGQGGFSKGSIVVVDKRAVEIQLTSFRQKPKNSSSITIATAIPKGDRQKVMIDMLTQLGVSRVIPLNCEHSVTRYSDNLALKWERTAIEACKQSQNPWLPTISSAQTVEQLLNSEDSKLAYADASGESIELLGRSLYQDKAANLTVIIGPEGGFSDNEIKLMVEQKCLPIKLGDFILRTESAAITTVSQFLLFNR